MDLSAPESSKQPRVSIDSAKKTIKSINDKLKNLNLSSASKEKLSQIGLLILGIKPKDRTEAHIEVLQRMTEDNKFFADVRSEFGDAIYRDMLRFVYIE